jgi:DnaA family protein
MPLNLGANEPQTLDTFVVGPNAELMHRLHTLSTRTATAQSESFVYLWGEPGAGKTHLLHALSALPAARYIPADADADAFLFQPDIRFYMLDDCDKLSDSAQIAAFALFNQVRENNGVMITAGNVAPVDLMLREDLRTRLGWGLIYHIHELTDDDKISALHHTAQVRGLTLSSGVLPYLITHFRRDMRSLSAMLDALDRYSLETKRPITLPLLRSLLQQESELSIQ